MRTLKKSLCLVLAIVMILGLGAFNVSALTTKDYSDAKQIKYGEAVDILGAIGVLEGDDDDNDGNIDFRPDATLTRAEAAKIITALLGVTAVNATMPFSDVPADHWAVNNIAYCAQQMIIEGTDDEAQTFEPEAQLTGGQFAKMLLVALGYDPSNTYAVLNGPTWLIGVSKLVHENSLADGIDDFASKYETPITRQDAAQMAFNTLCAPLVTYDNRGGTWIINGVSVTREASDPKYMTTNVRDTQTISSALVNDGSTNGTYIVEFAEKYQPKLVRVTTDADDFGRPCTSWSYNRVKLDSYPNTSLRVASWNDEIENKDAYKAIGSELIRRLGNNTDDADPDFIVWINGVEFDEATSELLYLDYWKKNNGDKDTGAHGQITEVYIDDDVYEGRNLSSRKTVVTVVVIDTFLGSISSAMNSKGEAKVTVVNEFVEEFGGPVVTVKESDVANIGDFKEDEKVLVQMTKPWDPNDRSVKVVMPCESLIDAYVNAYTSKDGKMDSVTNEGTKYSVAERAYWNSEILVDYTKRDLKGFTYDIYKDQFGNLIGIDFNKTDTDYVFVTAIKKSDSDYLSGGSYRASLIFADGTMDTKTVKLSNKTNTNAKDYFDAVRAGGLNGVHTTLYEANVDTATNLANGGGRSWKSGEDSGTIINRWFTYSKDDDGSITLRNCVGYKDKSGNIATDDIRQKAYYEPAGENNKAVISSSDVGLKTGKGTYAFGNDKSVYISVAIESDEIDGGAITKVNNVTTGIKNTNISTLNIMSESSKKLASTAKSNKKESFNNFALYLNGDNTNAFNDAPGKDEPWLYDYVDPKTGAVTKNVNLNEKVKSGAQWNNVFFIYSEKTHYVEYAVVISKLAARDVVYITSAALGEDGVTKSEYIQKVGYVDSYDAIYKGQKITIQVERDKTETNDVKLKAGNMYPVTFDADTGRVVDVDDALDGDGSEMSTEQNRTNGYALDLSIGEKDTVMIRGNTLYTSANLDSYVLVDSSTRFFVADYDATKADHYEEYRTASSAMSAAEENGKITRVYAECSKTTGFATSVILITNTELGPVEPEEVEDIIVLLDDDANDWIADGEAWILYSTEKAPSLRDQRDALQLRLGTNYTVLAAKAAKNADDVAGTEFTYVKDGEATEYTIFCQTENKNVVTILPDGFTIEEPMVADDEDGGFVVDYGTEVTVEIPDDGEDAPDEEDEEDAPEVTIDGDLYVLGNLVLKANLTVNGTVYVGIYGNITSANEEDQESFKLSADDVAGMKDFSFDIQELPTGDGAASEEGEVWVSIAGAVYSDDGVYKVNSDTAMITLHNDTLNAIQYEITKEDASEPKKLNYELESDGTTDIEKKAGSYIVYYQEIPSEEDE